MRIDQHENCNFSAIPATGVGLTPNTPAKVESEREVPVGFFRRFGYQTRRMAQLAESRETPAFGLICVDRELFVGSSAGM
jgi:hypothetical protein